mmetsp:Transcript_16682/g.63431  ORF Transcript_16682/g.63431 Transcript_16682/m.63431 type:complete len:231 (-) Transcript_16682:84-776(-)
MHDRSLAGKGASTPPGAESNQGEGGDEGGKDQKREQAGEAVGVAVLPQLPPRLLRAHDEIDLQSGACHLDLPQRRVLRLERLIHLDAPLLELLRKAAKLVGKLHLDVLLVRQHLILHHKTLAFGRLRGRDASLRSLRSFGLQAQLLSSPARLHLRFCELRFHRQGRFFRSGQASMVVLQRGGRQTSAERLLRTRRVTQRFLQLRVQAPQLLQVRFDVAKVPRGALLEVGS